MRGGEREEEREAGRERKREKEHKSTETLVMKERKRAGSGC